MKKWLLSLSGPMFLPVMLSTKCNAEHDTTRYEFKENFKNSNIKELYKETAKNAKYTIHFMQHGGYPISHQINSIIYLDKESNENNKQIMYWANTHINVAEKYDQIKGYNHKALSDNYDFIPFDAGKALSNNKENNNKGKIYFVKDSEKKKYDQYQEIADFIKSHPQQVDLSLTFLEWCYYLLEPQHAHQLYDILLNVRKIIIISDGTAQSSIFGEQFNKYKDHLKKLSTDEINHKFDDYKSGKLSKDDFLKNKCPLMWIYINKKVNGVPFISLVNYNVSYLENDYYKEIPQLNTPANAFQPVFLGKYAEWNKKAKPIIESVIKYPDNQPLLTKKSAKYDPKINQDKKS